jgi:hypothetical protein
MISERNDAREHGEPFAWSDFFPQFFLHPRELAVKSLQIHWQAAGLAMFYFWVPLSPGRATTDLKPRSTTCCPNSGSTSPSSTIARRKESSLTRKQPNQRSAPDPRSVRSQVVTPTPKTTSLFGTPCLRLHNATHITQHSKKKSKKGRIRNKPDINQL